MADIRRAIRPNVLLVVNPDIEISLCSLPHQSLVQRYKSFLAISFGARERNLA
jgi:hypothetical protein